MTATDTQPEREPADETPRRWPIGRVAVVTIVVALALMWIYVLFIAAPAPTDRLTDRTFPNQAEPACAATVARLRDAGVVNQHANTPQERAALVERSDAELTAMVAQLRTMLPPDTEARDAVTKWLDDWEQWLRDRAVWVTKLRAGQDAPFLEKQDAAGAPNSKSLNDFAVTNEMNDCQTPVGV